MSRFTFAFMPMFVAMDPFGGFPYFLALTAYSRPDDWIRVLFTAIVTAAFALFAFLEAGHTLLNVMGITLHDFEVAGGVVILALAISDLLSKSSTNQEALSQQSTRNVGVVPIGIPLLAGPAAFTTEILLLHHVGPWLTLVSIALNLLLTAVFFYTGRSISRFMNPAILEAIGRFAGLLLAAYGVMMIREGLGLRMTPLP
jgi:multiple antibiotic resistance protein